MLANEIEDVLNKISKYTKKYKKIPSQENNEDIKDVVKTLYDFTKAKESKTEKNNGGALPKLIVKDFDEEQIWQELELQNSECFDGLVWEVANCMSSGTNLEFPVEVVEPQDEEPSENEETSDEMDEESGDESMDEDNQEQESAPIIKPKSKGKQSIVDDQFFKLNEMEKFLLKQEKEGGTNQDSDEESIDYFEEEDDDETDDEGNAKYMDFFNDGGDEQVQERRKRKDQSDDEEGDDIEEDGSGDEIEEDGSGDEMSEDEQPKKNDKKVRFADSGSDGSSDEEVNEQVVTQNPDKNEKKSEFELRQQRLKQQISKLEEKNLSEAPWQLKGEVDANKRPANSLLQEVVDFDLTTRPAPIITEQTTITLEDIIRQRIKDKAWDDVEKKEKPVDDALAFRKTEVLDQAKSKQSLAEVYEAEYLKQKQKLSGDVEDEKEPEAHTQIREQMNSLFAKLDALSNYHYTPKAAQKEVTIVSNTPAITMEEVAPVAASEATLLAPEEVKRKRKGDLISKEERDSTDKKRERRRKKKLQKAKGHVEKVTNHRNTSKSVEGDTKSLKTSKAFFQQLNNDANSLIKKTKSVKGK